MKTVINKHLKRNFIILFMLLLLPVFISAETEKSVIKFSSDKMEYNPTSKFNELSGNVEVTYQSYVINSDKLKIYFLETASITKKETDKKDGGAKIEKIVATGNVKIKFDNRVATSEKAEYFIKTEDLILSGKDTRIEFDGNSFVGTRVTFNRITQKMSMEGNKDTQLKGIIISDEVLEQ